MEAIAYHHGEMTIVLDADHMHGFAISHDGEIIGIQEELDHYSLSDFIEAGQYSHDVDILDIPSHYIEVKDPEGKNLVFRLFKDPLNGTAFIAAAKEIISLRKASSPNFDFNNDFCNQSWQKHKLPGQFEYPAFGRDSESREIELFEGLINKIESTLNALKNICNLPINEITTDRLQKPHKDDGYFR